jgi:dTDP-4-dehydrorhamnose reductase
MPGLHLLIGGDSEIGAAAAAYLRRLEIPFAATTRRPELVTVDRPFLDLAAPLDDWQPPSQTCAACIFVAVARLQDCARNPAGSSHINVIQTLRLIGRLRDLDIPVLFLSSDKVFDGSRPYVSAGAPTCPATEYGRQKAEAEAALLPQMVSGPPLAILRLSKTVSPNMALLHQWLTALSSGTAIRTFSDLFMAPVPVALVVAAVVDLLSKPAGGLFQLSGPHDVSYDEIGHYLARKVGAAPQLVTPISTAAAGMPPGTSPRHTTLDSTTVCARLSTVVPDPWVVIDGVVESWRQVPPGYVSS